ncbi:cell division protein ZapE [Tropicimonas sp.]|uniref:cell division protein ZapE n=1 Tax=Tropicimonas sp. TaxID=2067044 RepID=UPI003A8C438C
MTRSLTEIYDERVAGGLLAADRAQLAALPELERVRRALGHAKPRPRGGLRGFFSKSGEPEPVRGLYLWGGVGRGKSMLMDLFFEAVRTHRKRRVHFHAFMQEVHAGFHEARKRGVRDPIVPVADEVIAHVDLLCFDEMQITDITDAMIVGRLFERLFAAGVVVVTTSNRAPDELYKDGLNRQLFLPFIDMLKAWMVVRELASDTDYRQEKLAGSPVYFTPNDHAARQAIQRIWDDLTGGDAPPLVLTVKARPVEIPAFRNGVGRAGFFDLCGRPLGPADYLAIAEVVKVLVLTDIPCLGRSNFNEAKRFVILIDALYEAKVRLICSAAAEPGMLYLEGEGSFEFERTASRLREMQALDWGVGDRSVAAGTG